MPQRCRVPEARLRPRRTCAPRRARRSSRTTRHSRCSVSHPAAAYRLCTHVRSTDDFKEELDETLDEDDGERTEGGTAQHSATPRRAAVRCPLTAPRRARGGAQAPEEDHGTPAVCRRAAADGRWRVRSQVILRQRDVIQDITKELKHWKQHQFSLAGQSGANHRAPRSAPSPRRMLAHSRRGRQRKRTSRGRKSSVRSAALRAERTLRGRVDARARVAQACTKSSEAISTAS